MDTPESYYAEDRPSVIVEAHVDLDDIEDEAARIGWSDPYGTVDRRIAHAQARATVGIADALTRIAIAIERVE